MLGDSPEKTKNPLKKAIRRRNAKTVQFAAPTYVEASDYDYDTEDEENALLAESYNNDSAATATAGATATETETAEHMEITPVEADEGPKSTMPDSLDDTRSTVREVKPPVEESLTSPTLVDRTGKIGISLFTPLRPTNTCP